MKDVMEKGKALRRPTPEVRVVTNPREAIARLGEQARKVVSVLPQSTVFSS